jgi:hypothetical protein
MRAATGSRLSHETIVPDSKEWNEISSFFSTSRTMSYLMVSSQSLGVSFSAACGGVVPCVV